MSKYILRELCKNVTDGEHGTVPYEIGSPYYLLSAKNLLNGKIVLTDNERTISKQSFDKIRKRTGLEKDDVLISTVGTIGNLAIADEVSYYEFNRDVGIFKCNKEKLIPEYLYYFLSTNAQQKRMMKIAKGVTQKHLYISDLEEIDIDIPNVQEQSNAIHLLKRIDGKIGLNKKVISNLESMSKTLYDYWFVQFDFPNDNGHPYKTSGGKMEWNETLSREIPAGWEVSSIGCITENFDSQRIPLSAQERQAIKGEIPYYGATDVMDYVNRPIFKGQYVLIAEDGSVMDANGFPFVQMIYGNSWVNNHAHVLRGKNGYSNERLYLLLKEIPVVSIKTGSIQAKINQNNLNSYNIVIPKRDIATLFDNKIIPVFDKIRELKEENRKLTSLREFLLPMLMNGQVTFHQ